MAIPRIKATYSLDVETVHTLERVARRWGVSKSEALRRAIHASETLPDGADPRLALLDTLQQTATLGAGEAAAWTRQVRAERRARGGATRVK